ncbi:MAG: histidinol-phosphatase HisJ family protein [Verrucomicrobiae bacterium]|nr:histidinol-phosphatase HisJ family protein [Verrucomicrobiae bacterium]
MKIFSDYHTHPQAHQLQPYTEALLQPWAETCRKKGITDIAFTDHDRYHQAVDFNVIETVREKNPDLKIRAGIELDNDPVNSAAGRKWVEKNWDRLDFVLGSVHFLDNWAFDHAGQEKEFQRRNIDEVYAYYIKNLDHLISQGHIDCLAHLDLIKIFKFFPTQPFDQLFRPILEQIKKANLAMEVSTAGWRKPVNIPYPDQTIIRLALELKIPFTLASDAHSHFQIAEHYDRLAQLLTELGIQEIAIYEKHQRQLITL